MPDRVAGRHSRRNGLVACSILLAACVRLVGLEPTAASAGVTVETGVDVLSEPQSEIGALHRISVFSGGQGVHFGQSLYSAAVGDAGGAFFWGYEFGAEVDLAPRLAAKFGAFIGGGGGAAQVVGDGLMMRGSVGLSYRVAERISLEGGAAWIVIDGAEVDGPAVSVGLSFGEAASRAALLGSGLRVSSVSVGPSLVMARGSIGRSGNAQQDMILIGAQAVMPLDTSFDGTLAADGAAMGGEGYMQVLGGFRRSYALGPGEVFGQASLGFGGGGDVDTGGGGVALVGVGASVPIGSSQAVEASLARMFSDGQIKGDVLSLRLRHQFGQAESLLQEWRLSTGVLLQAAHAGFRRGGGQGEDVLLQETAIDMVLTDRLYVVGAAGTALQGNAAGYATGTLGLGYRIPLGEKFAASFEAHLGAAGGGGVDVAGGAVIGVRVELDYRLTHDTALSFAVGKLRSRNLGGMAPLVLQAGLKLDFKTH